MRRVPRLRRQAQRGRSDRAFVEINGKRTYLGTWQSPEAMRRYSQLIAELAENPEPLPDVSRLNGLTVGHLIVDYLNRTKAETAGEDGRPGQDWIRTRNATRALFALYGALPAREFGPRALAAVRNHWLEHGAVKLGEDALPLEESAPNGRRTANANTRRIINVVRWGVALELVDDRVLYRLEQLQPLKLRPEDRANVRPVPDAHIEAIEPHVSPQVMALVRLLRVTGARPGELVRLTPGDIEQRDAELWTIALDDHKNAHRGQVRRIHVGPRGIEVIRPFLEGREDSKPLFSAREGVRWLNDQKPTHRSQPNGRPRTGRTVKDFYTVDSLRRAIARACEAAGIARWHPHQLRHSRGTELRKLAGLEVAKAVLGHASLQATAIYAERDDGVAEQAARVWG